jgi:hypothetical protein
VINQKIFIDDIEAVVDEDFSETTQSSGALATALIAALLLDTISFLLLNHGAPCKNGQMYFLN